MAAFPLAGHACEGVHDDRGIDHGTGQSAADSRIGRALGDGTNGRLSVPGDIELQPTLRLAHFVDVQPTKRFLVQRELALRRIGLHDEYFLSFELGCLRFGPSGS